MSKEEIRQRAAIAVLPECVRETHEVLSNGGKLIEETQAKQAAMMAVAYADALAERFENGEEPEVLKIKKGEWYCCTQNMIDSVGSTIFTIGKMYRSYEDGYLLDNYAHQAKIDIIANKYFEHIENGEAILSIPERTGKDCKPANLSKSSKFLQALINEEIQRRCEGIDVDEMFDEVPPRIFKTDFDFYKKGVVDTINKLKGK